MAVSEWKLNDSDRLNAYFLSKNKFYCKLSKSLDYAKPFCLPYFLLKYKIREKVVEKPFSTGKMYNFFYVKNSMLAYYFVYLNTSPEGYWYCLVAAVRAVWRLKKILLQPITLRLSCVIGAWGFVHPPFVAYPLHEIGQVFFYVKKIFFITPK